jgi:hypothetical protein
LLPYSELTRRNPDISRAAQHENDQFAPNDDFDSAARIPEGFSDARLINNESDFYRLQANTTDALDVAVQGENLQNITFLLYSPDRQRLIRDSTPDDGLELISKVPANGTYYLEVRSQVQQASTDYTLNVDRITPAENDQFAPNDDFDSAAQVSEGFTDARLVGGESDFYRLQASATDAVEVGVQNPTLRNVALILYGPDRRTIIGDRDPSNGINLTTKLPADGIYYLEVRGQTQQATTDYTLRIDRITPAENDQFAPNDEFESAAVITSRFTQARLVGGESDFYFVGLKSNGSLAIGVQNANLQNLELVLYGPDRQPIVKDGNSNFDGISATVSVSEPGIYYVEVRGQTQQTTTAYTLRSNQTGNKLSTATPTLTIVSPPPASVRAGTGVEITYRITNTGDETGTFTATVPQISENLSVTGFAGDIQDSAPEDPLPSASIPSVAPGRNASVTVRYRVAPNATGTANVTVETTPTLSGVTDSVATSIEVGSPPSAPRARALQAAAAETPAEITQSDITIAITRRERGQRANGIELTQSDITALITLRDRA